MNKPIPDGPDGAWLVDPMRGLMERFAPCRVCPAVTNASPRRMLPGRAAVVEVLDTLGNLLFPSTPARRFSAAPPIAPAIVLQYWLGRLP